MAIALTSAYRDELKKSTNTPDVIVEMWLDDGTQEAVDSAFDYDGAYTDVTASLNSDATDAQLFGANGDILYIGMSTKFTGLYVQLDTAASDEGITPTFEYSTPGSTWTTFTPHDATNGMQDDGSISWPVPRLTSWVSSTVNSVDMFWIRITRGAPTLTTPPTEDLIQVLHSSRLGIAPSFRDVKPVLGKVSSLQNKLDTEKGYSTRGNFKFTIIGRENFRSLIQNSYLKNRRVMRYDGFIADGFAFEDYAPTFSGFITNWARKGDTLTVTVSDDMNDASDNIPVEEDGDTQYIDYSNANPVDIIQDILLTQLGIDSAFVDSVKMDSEQSTWLNSWAFNRVITEPQEASKYLSELQIETNSFLFHDGEKISFKTFAPPVPGDTVVSWSDTDNIIDNSLTQDSGYKEHFYNRAVVYYDYDESGSDDSENFSTVQISSDLDSQSSTQWDETTTKIIKSKWIKSHTFDQPTTVTGVTVYHTSKTNGAGGGTLAYTFSTNSITWTAPGGTVGTAVELSEDGKYDILDADGNKYIRVIVDTALLPGSDKSDTITITSISGSSYARSLASKILSRYKNPAATVSFEVDINDTVLDNNFLKLADLVDLTTDEASEKGDSTWTAERMLITSMRPDYTTSKVKVEATEAKMYVNYGFISPASHVNDWDKATPLQKQYAFVGAAADNTLGAASDDGFFVW